MVAPWYFETTFCAISNNFFSWKASVAVSKSRTINCSVAFSWIPFISTGCTKPSLPPVTSGHQESFGNAATISAAIFIALIILPFAYPGCALTPSITIVAASALNVSSSNVPTSPPSSVNPKWAPTLVRSNFSVPLPTSSSGVNKILMSPCLIAGCVIK